MLTLMMALVACSSPVDDNPFSEEIEDAEYVWSDDLEYMTDDLTAENFGFYALGENGLTQKYTASKLFSRLRIDRYGAQHVGDGLGTLSDWQNGQSAMVFVESDTGSTLFLRSDIPFGSTMIRWSASADNMPLCIQDQLDAGVDPEYAEEACWWDHEMVAPFDPTYDRYSCVGYDDQGKWGSNEAARVYSDGWVEPVNGDCGRSRY